MRSVKFAAVPAALLLLSACGGGTSEEPAGEDAAATEETAATEAASEAPAATETPAADATASASPTPEPTSSATVAAAAPPVAPPATYNQCKVCHSVKKGENGLGPTLAGIYNSKAAAVPGFDFSPAMAASGLKWDEATLDKYIADPRGTVPGTKMAFAGIKDAAKRKELIAYLKTL